MIINSSIGVEPIQNARPLTGCPFTKEPINVPWPNQFSTKPAKSCTFATRAETKITGIVQIIETEITGIPQIVEIKIRGIQQIVEI